MWFNVKEIDLDVLDDEGNYISSSKVFLSSEEILFLEPIVIDGEVVVHARTTLGVYNFTYSFYVLYKYYDKYRLKMMIYGPSLNSKLHTKDYYFYSKLNRREEFILKWRFQKYTLSRINFQKTLIDSGLMLALYETGKWLLKKFIV